MELHQIQVVHHIEEDRVLCRASFKAEDGTLQEVRAWLTRRMIRNLWAGLMNALATQVTLDKPHAAHASAEIVSMEHHASIEAIKSSGNFTNFYETNVQAYPLGETPILVTTATFTLKARQSIRIHFVCPQGQGFELAFTPATLHGFCILLSEAVIKAEWDLDLALPGASNTSSAAMRVLN